MDFGPREVVSLLRSVRPFISGPMATVAELMEYSVDMFASKEGQKALQLLGKLVSDKSGTAGRAELQGKTMGNPFSLFLVLILLILSFGTEDSVYNYKNEAPGSTP